MYDVPITITHTTTFPADRFRKPSTVRTVAAAAESSETIVRLRDIKNTRGAFERARAVTARSVTSTARTVNKPQRRRPYRTEPQRVGITPSGRLASVCPSVIRQSRRTPVSRRRRRCSKLDACQRDRKIARATTRQSVLSSGRCRACAPRWSADPTL